MTELDALDLALVTALRDSPRAGALELSRVTRVAQGHRGVPAATGWNGPG